MDDWTPGKAFLAGCGGCAIAFVCGAIIVGALVWEHIKGNF